MRKLFESKYFKIGLTFFAAGALLIILFQMVTSFSGFRHGLQSVIRVISPFIYGFVMAYLLNPVYNFVTRNLYKLTKNTFKTHKRAFGFSKAIATIVALVIFLGVVIGLMALVIPQIVSSITGIIDAMPGRMAQLNTLIVRITSNMENREIAAQIMEFWENAEDRLIDWAKDTLMPGLGVIMQKISSRVILTLKTLLNLIIGVIVCVYFLNGKDKFKAQIKKVITALFRRDTANEIFEFGNYAHHAFGGFITGKIIDSIIIGVICFIAMSIFRLPYPLLISVIVGVTNIIPFFGPFIGAVPSALIILMVSPIQALYFLILVIILQQLDGNIIGPAILGNSTGLSSFWVLFSIVIFGGLFGPVGMIIGVPVFAVIYYYAGKWIRKRLRNKGLEDRTEEYEEYNEYDFGRKEIRDEKDR
ncbi:MAG: AI-2E family transporter [Clostridia bacterium]|nr:AI-2E family transporter [Clostridia bacterium]